MKIGKDGLSVIGSLVKLRSLVVFGSPDRSKAAAVNDDVLAAWRGLTDLRMLWLFRCDVSDRGMAVVASLPKLRSLRIDGNVTITDKSLALTRECQDLHLAIPNVTNHGMSMFGKLMNLETLELSGAKRVDADGLAALAPLAKLESLSLYAGAQLEGPDCAVLAELTNLKKLNLSGWQVGDDAVAAIGNLRHLEALNLRHTGLTNAQLQRLAALDALVELRLDGNPIDDAGLEALRPLKQLRQLFLIDAKTTDEGRTRLKAAIPGLYINADGINQTIVVRPIPIHDLFADESP